MRGSIFLMPNPIYTSENVRVAFQLNWGYSLFWHDAGPGDLWFPKLRELCEAAGLRILSHQLKTPTCSQFCVSTRPDVSPDKIPKGIKGRLQTLVRETRPNAFQRNYDLHSIGSTQREKVEHYVAGQLTHHAEDDVVINDSSLADLQITNPEVDLSRFRLTSHARYRFNLHIVLRFSQAVLLRDANSLVAVRKAIRSTARKHQHLLSRAGLLQDHVHLVLGVSLASSPLNVALSYMNNIAWMLGQKPVLNFTTVQTYLKRLEAKGYLKVRLESRSRIYSPRVKPRTVIRETVDDLVERLFAGEAMPLMRHLVEEKEFSADEIDQLRSLLNRLDGERNE
jgi:predicted transcriptional regulator